MPERRKIGVALGFILALFAGIAASTHLRAAQTASSAADIPAQDADFVQRAIHGAMLQIELGKVAAVHGENPRIRELATAGARNLSKAEDLLRMVAQSLQLPLHPALPQDVATLSRALAADSGPVLDAEFVGLLLPANTVAVNLFASEANHGSNPGLVRFARDMLPKLEQRQANLLRLTYDMSGLIAGAEPNPPMRLPEYQAPQNATSQAEELSRG